MVGVTGAACALVAAWRFQHAGTAGVLAALAAGAICLAGALTAIARFDLDPPPRILITGSLYLAGAVLAANGTPPT